MLDDNSKSRRKYCTPNNRRIFLFFGGWCSFLIAIVGLSQYAIRRRATPPEFDATLQSIQERSLRSAPKPKISTKPTPSKSPPKQKLLNKKILNQKILPPHTLDLSDPNLDDNVFNQIDVDSSGSISERELADFYIVLYKLTENMAQFNVREVFSLLEVEDNADVRLTDSNKLLRAMNYL